MFLLATVVLDLLKSTQIIRDHGPPQDKVTARSGQQETQADQVVPYPVTKFQASADVLHTLFKILNYIQSGKLNLLGGKLYSLTS